LTYAVGGLLALIGSGVAVAQQPEGGIPEFDLPGGKPVKLSPAEQLEQAQGFVSTMERVRESVRRDLEEARSKGDVVKKLCLDDKLNQLDIALRKASEREKALENAVRVNDGELSNHEFTILSVLNQRATALDAEAKLCIGKEVVAVGDSSTQMDIEGAMPDESQTTAFPTPPLVTEPPACASCFR
jgi:hypothetical protein